MTVTAERPTTPPTASPATAMRFVTASPLLQARKCAEREMKGQATAAQIVWLHDRPVLWLRALNRLKIEAQGHTAKDKLDLGLLKPAAGAQPTDQYLAAKLDFETRHKARLHFMGIVDDRIEQVKAKLGTGPAYGWITTGDLVDIFASIAALADSGDRGDMDSAAEKAWFWADKFGAQLLNEDDQADTTGGPE